MVQYSNEEIVKMYSQMAFGRIYQEIILERLAQGKMTKGFYHLSIGVESIGAGMLNAMGPDDYVLPHHRQHSLLLAKLDPKLFTAELMGRTTGYGRGKSFEFHLSNPELKILPNGAILGSHGPYSVGVALALKLDKRPGAVISCCGEGTTSEGNMHEAMNLASVLKVPIVFMFDNNGWAMSQPARRQFATANIADRAAGYNMPSMIADGHDVFAVRETMEAALDLARQGKPNIVEFKTIRLRGHFEGDMQKDRDDATLVEECKTNDCNKRVEKLMIDKSIMNASDIDTIKAKMRKQVEEAFAFAETQPLPDEAETLDPHQVYSNVPGGARI
jgi:acetoin:2,6-dichlorophenolindophenol oxidoreductase subunit alpha